MKNEVLLAGFGGQDVLAMGLFIAYAGMAEGKRVTYGPSYGAEMRGGTVNCLVTIADEEISSPLVANPRILVAMNRPSLDKFEPMVKPGGVVFINSTLINQQPACPAQRPDRLRGADPRTDH